MPDMVLDPPGETAITRLTDQEQTTLQDCEATIEAGLQSFVDVGQALLAIRDQKLYRVGHRNFDDYCRDRWGMSRFYAHRLVDASAVVKRLEDDIKLLPMGNNLPTSERQTRPLTRLPAGQQPAAWREAVETAPGGRVTAGHVDQVVRRFSADDLPFDPDQEPIPAGTGAVSAPPAAAADPGTGAVSAPSAAAAAIVNRVFVIGALPDEVTLTILAGQRVKVESRYDAKVSLAELLGGVIQLCRTAKVPGAETSLGRPGPPAPDIFPSPDAATWYAVGRGAFDNAIDAFERYEALKSQHRIRNAREMALHWLKEIARRTT